MKLYLYYPSYIHGRPHKAIAVAEARETPKQWIVSRDDVEMIETSGVRFGPPEIRFWKTGQSVGMSGINTWRATTTPH